MILTFFLSILCLALSYLLGSIPFGLLLTRLAGLGDIRQIGSGNIGGTNVLRTGHKGLAVLTVFLDGAKGTAAVLLALTYAPVVAPFAALAALLGHMFPVWIGFKGGKGVATFFGAILAFSWPVGLFAMATWLAVALLTRMSSLSALIAVAATPIFFTIFEKGPSLGIVLMMGILVFIKHKENIIRLVNGKEPKIGQSKNDDDAAA